MSFSERVIALIEAIPAGRVATYGQIATAAGNPRGARGVVWILRSSSKKHNLPWHRVVAAGGRIALREGEGREEQILRLGAEGIPVTEACLPIDRYQWDFRDTPWQNMVGF